MQEGENIRSDGAARSHESRTFAPVRSPFVTRLLPEHEARLDVLKSGDDRLLSVRQAAAQLGLCTATIYGLCADGALAHIRILNTIRIAPADLAAFIAARRVELSRF